MHYCFRSDPSRAILEFQLAWVLDFSFGKKMGNPNFFEIIPHLPTAPGAFLNRAPQNILISIEIEPLVLDMQ